MKLKKAILTGSTFLAAILTLTTSSLATHTGVYGIKMIREGGKGYKHSESIVWRVVKYDNVEMNEGAPVKNTGTIDWSKSVYCLKAGVGFGSSSDSIPLVEQDRVLYTNEEVLAPVDISSESGRTLGSGLENTNHNACIWVLDHIYLPKHADQTERKILRDELLTAAFADKIADGTISNISQVTLTDDEIEMVGQLAVWYFTNADDSKYHLSSLSTINETINTDGTQVDSVSLEKQEDANTLYQYLITAATSAAPLYATTRAVPTITQDTSEAMPSVVIENEKAVVGPIKINMTGLENIYNFGLEVSAKAGTEDIVSPVYSIVKEDKQTEVTTIGDVNGQNIYVILNNKNITQITLSVTGKYAETTITRLDAGEDEQPIAVVEKEFKPLSLDIAVEKEKQFDLALRKFITAVNGVAPKTSRVPVVNTEELQNGNSQTATYTHPKNNVVVKSGDKVTYTLRVYNEGEIAGFAKEIMDTIPEGLEFIPENQTNITYGWKMYKQENGTLVETTNAAEATIVKTDYLSSAENLIPEFNKQTGEISHKDVQLVFEVVEPNSSTRVLKNIAEITNDADENGNDVTDRDSLPGNVNENTYPDSTNVEDDDDFEKLVLNEFDLALRKFITAVNDKEITSREPEVDVTKLKNGTSKTATYTHPKTPVAVQTGDKVTYTIRVYNEGETSGYASQITDHIPEGLKFLVNDATNIEYMWRLLPDGKTITTNYLSEDKDETNLILAFDPDTMQTLHYKEVKVVFEVIEPNTSNKVIKNIAEISDDSDQNGNAVIDRDSLPGNVDKTTYPDNTNVEDDDDFEKIKLEYFDLALRKFITSVNGKSIITRVPVVDASKLISGASTTATYTHTKTPVAVQKGDKVVYTIRVYNEGGIDGYAEEITDHIPDGLKLVPQEESTINAKYDWQLSEDGKSVTTDYLSETKSNQIIKGFDGTTTPSFRDVQIEFEVTEENTSERVLRNIAEITADSNKDIDSEPGNVDIDNYNPPASTQDENGNTVPGDNSSYQQDDDDYEDLVLQYFDLSLRKFITKINEQVVDTRVPQVGYDEDGKLEYDHLKDPILVANNDIVIYTIRVYNEGKMSGYASQITDDIPEGLAYLPEHETNKKYGWTVSQDGKTVSTDYLSKEKSEERNEDALIKAFDKNANLSENEPLNPDYRDVQIAFKVTEKNLPSSRIIINTAEITNDQDENGDPVVDEDSDPGNLDPDEDDIDKEYIKVKYFDLSLLKWVSKVYLTENGETTVTDTGHTGLENPEPVVKVDLHRKKINSVTVKFGYVIQITNEGEIEGYATEISDYIPEGLKFVKEDNPDWEEVDGKIVTRALENTLLKPGESASIEVILTWINDGENMGTMVNVAEISEDKNPHDAKDIDSTPNNKKDGEDDIDDAPVLLTVQTGGAANIAKYTILAALILAILAVGIIAIKKYVL